MNLSWFNAPETENPMDLIEFQSTLSVDSLAEAPVTDVAYKDIWVTNNGTEEGTDTLVEFGFFIDADTPADIASILKLSEQTHSSGYPCGLYIVFGYETNIGTGSYIEQIEEETINPLEITKFHVTWSNGLNPLNKIKLNSAYTYNGVSYSVRTNLPKASSTLNTNGESGGSLKVRVLFLGPTTGNSILSNIRVNAHALKEV